MLPIRDHNPSGRTPFVVYALMAINIGVFLTYAGLPERQVLQQIYVPYALIPARLGYGEGFGTLITSTFLHGGVLHLAGNMLFLWIFGDNLEDEMGHAGFLLFYLACAVGAGLIHVLASPGSMVPTVGASGAIAGVMGGYLLLYPKARVDILIILVIFFRIIAIPAWLMLGLWLGMQLLGGFNADPNAGGVAYWAHAGGFAAGVALTLARFLWLGGPGYWRRTHGHPPHPPSQFAPSRIPPVRRP